MKGNHLICMSHGPVLQKLNILIKIWLEKEKKEKKKSQNSQAFKRPKSNYSFFTDFQLGLLFPQTVQ